MFKCYNLSGGNARANKLMARAKKLNTQYKWEAAVEPLKELLQAKLSTMDAGHADVQYLCASIGNCYRNVGNWEKAVSYYDRVVEAVDVSVDVLEHCFVVRAWEGKSEKHVHDQNWDLTLECLDKAVEAGKKLKTDNAHNHLLFGLYHNKANVMSTHQENYAEAIDVYKLAEAVYPRCLNCDCANHEPPTEFYLDFAHAYFHLKDSVQLGTLLKKAWAQALHDKVDNLYQVRAICSRMFIETFGVYPRALGYFEM